MKILRLSKETLRNLNAAQLRGANGGETADTCNTCKCNDQDDPWPFSMPRCSGNGC